jgi:hypothetical protein
LEGKVQTLLRNAVHCFVQAGLVVLGLCAMRLTAWAAQGETTVSQRAGAGFAAVYLQSSVQNYQIYAAAPVEVRLAYAASDVFFAEFGARFRTFQNRVDGYVAKHADLMYFFGLGVFTPRCHVGCL